jgi:hypothetical protein
LVVFVIFVIIVVKPSAVTKPIIDATSSDG